MLFDLRGRGRRTTIKVIYVTLAVLMGGGLVLFGIGGDVSGGLVDAITDRQGGDSGEERYEKQEQAALVRTQREPANAPAWAELVRSRVRLAQFGDRYDSNTGNYTEEGKVKLREAAAAWERFLALDPPSTDDTSTVASLMVRAFVALNDVVQAARAQEIVAEARRSAGTYSQLAFLSYQAGQTRKGDLAAEKAIELTPEDRRETLKGQLEQAKQQGAISQVTPPEGG